MTVKLSYLPLDMKVNPGWQSGVILILVSTKIFPITAWLHISTLPLGQIQRNIGTCFSRTYRHGPFNYSVVWVMVSPHLFHFLVFDVIHMAVAATNPRLPQYLKFSQHWVLYPLCFLALGKTITSHDRSQNSDDIFIKHRPYARHFARYAI